MYLETICRLEFNEITQEFYIDELGIDKPQEDWEIIAENSDWILTSFFCEYIEYFYTMKDIKITTEDAKNKYKEIKNFFEYLAEMTNIEISLNV